MQRIAAITYGLILLLLFLPSSPAHSALYVAVNGNDSTGNGSAAAPWATITHALDNAMDNAEILVRPGTYTGRIRIRGSFPIGVTVRSEKPYQAKLRNNDRVITAYASSSEINNITLEGFDIAHSGPGAGALIIHIDGGGNKAVHHITLRNNILHNSYNNDILKINNAATHVLVQGNMFFNQTGSDEHIDINSVEHIVVRDNIFFNNFEGSGRTNLNNTGSFIVIKDSNGSEDQFTGSRDITINRNIFFNWQGSSGSCFILIGEDGKPYFEAMEVVVENNLLLGNSEHVMRSPFGVKGGRDILFRNNTISGDLPALAYGMRLNTEGENPANDNIRFFNNIWSDPTMTMGAENPSRPNDFSDTPLEETLTFSLHSNLYWNGGAPIPTDSNEKINVSDDTTPVTQDPRLKKTDNIPVPIWDDQAMVFSSGETTIRQVFEHLARQYATLPANSSAIDQANNLHAPLDDILGQSRPMGLQADIGAFEFTANTPPSEPAPNLTPLQIITNPILLLLMDKRKM